MLLPQETNLFPEEDVSPMWAIETRGHSRPARPKPAIYQLNRQTCPYLTRQNKCLIYKRRPLICRAYPLTIHIDGKADLDKKCQACHQAKLYNIEGKPKDLFPKEVLNANVALHRAYYKTFIGEYDKVFLFDLKTKTWLTLGTEELKEIHT
jgi:Fe-S-cluster containining protein